MKYISFLLFFVLTGCLSNYRLSNQAESNRAEMVETKVGMSYSKFISIMGRADKVETRKMYKIQYTTLYYVTSAAQLYQTELLDKNYTPFVFYQKKLIGKGYLFYNNLFDINNARAKQEDEKRQAYTNDKEEWPSNKHQIIDFSENSDLETILNESIEKTPEINPSQEQLQENIQLDQKIPELPNQEKKEIIEDSKQKYEPLQQEEKQIESNIETKQKTE